MKISALALLIAASTSALAQTTAKVTVKAQGDDVRKVLASVFDQAKQQYVLPSGTRFALFLSLEDAPFEKALAIVCRQANLEAVYEDGVYHVRAIVKKEPVLEKTALAPAPAPKIEPKVVVASPKPKAVPSAAYARRVTTRLQRADLRIVLATLADQAGVPIEVDPAVPAYRVDAFLVKTSFRYALDRITKAANLSYRATDRGTILVSLR